MEMAVFGDRSDLQARPGLVGRVDRIERFGTTIIALLTLLCLLVGAIGVIMGMNRANGKAAIASSSPTVAQTTQDASR